MRYLYTLIIHCYGLSIRAASLFTEKARLWVQGRKDLFNRLKTLAGDKPVFWMHCASLGEFEQGRPIMEAFRSEHPEYRVVLTFFSPSGYEIRKNYDRADIITYLPLDTPRKVRQFLDLVSPDLVIFIKYEYWFNYIQELHHRKIPVFFVSGIFRKNQHFFTWYGGWFRKQLKNITHFFVQNTESESLLHSIGIKSVTVSGDTRFDRVRAVTTLEAGFPALRQFADNDVVLIAGSTWPEDEAILFPALLGYMDRLKLIIAPHEIREERLISLMDRFGNKVVRLSALNAAVDPEIRIVLVDSIGHLSGLYRFARIAFIGGGFGKGIHNILEPAAFGLPVIFGPNYRKFMEAKELIRLHGAFPIRSRSEFESMLESFLSDTLLLSKTSETCKNFVIDNSGATSRVMDHLNTWIHPKT